jgi:8-oxo-dGTP diphosphatase
MQDLFSRLWSAAPQLATATASEAITRTKSRNVVEKKTLKPEFRRRSFMRVRVSAVFEQAGEILCMKYVYGGKEVFALPGGGVDKDIPLREAIINEWREELGVKVDIGDIILIGEAPAGKRHPQTLHIVFEALEIRGTPKVRPDATHSLDVAWVSVDKLSSLPLYPDVGKQLSAGLTEASRRSVAFIDNCMERGYW